MPRPAGEQTKGWLGAFLDQGVTGAGSDPLRKRVRLTNAAALLGTIITLGTAPFDVYEAPRWMVAQDLLAAAVFFGITRLNRRGLYTTARLGTIGISSFLALTQAVVLGRDSGVDLIFLGLLALPFVLFEISERGPLVCGVLIAIAGFVVTDTGMLAPFQDQPARYSAHDYHLYSATLAVAVVLSSLVLMSLANARSERALRHDIEERERTERELAETRQASITSAKMAALGEMSANVAHEVNNPLAAILLRAQRLRLLAQKDRLDSAAVLKAASEIDSTVDRIRRIVDALRAFSRQADDDAFRPERVSAIVADTVGSTSASSPSPTTSTSSVEGCRSRRCCSTCSATPSTPSRTGRCAGCASPPTPATARSASPSPTAARGSRPRSSLASWSRSSPPSRPGEERASGCRSRRGSPRPTGAA